MQPFADIRAEGFESNISYTATIQISSEGFESEIVVTEGIGESFAWVMEDDDWLWKK